MRTNIILDDNLVDEAFKIAGNIHTKRELVETALKEFIGTRKRKDLRELKGKIRFDENYNYKKMRLGE
jgi:Arc/MetJ family transcription regulator